MSKGGVDIRFVRDFTGSGGKHGMIPTNGICDPMKGKPVPICTLPAIIVAGCYIGKHNAKKYFSGKLWFIYSHLNHNIL